MSQGMSTDTLRRVAIACFIVALGVLLIGGLFANRHAPPYPGKVAGPGEEPLFTKEDILAGQDVYQRYGLMDHGSVWGHGSQRGMEFSAVTVHLIGETVREEHALAEYGRSYDGLTEEQKEIVGVRARREIKTNRYDEASDTLLLTANQAKALQRVESFWERTFGEGEERYGFLPDTVPTAEERRRIARFFYWTAWVASTNRPDGDHSYTNNWPPDRTVGNVATTETYIW